MEVQVTVIQASYCSVDAVAVANGEVYAVASFDIDSIDDLDQGRV